MARDLVTAHVLLQCTDPDHRNTCKNLRDDLMENFLEVKQASTVKAIGEENFCVIGIATINPKKHQQFEAALRKLEKSSTLGSDQSAVRVYLTL